MDYQRIYNQLIERAQTRTLKSYTEKHHIIPKCLGGNNDKENLVRLTPKEHFMCHRLLCKIYPKENKLKQALWLMSIQMKKKGVKVTSRVYEILKIEYINTVKGKPKSEEYKLKIGLKNLGPKPKGFGNKISSIKKGKPLSKLRMAVFQYDLKGNFIKEWTYSNEAETQLGINHNDISACCRGKNKTAGGFTWSYNRY